MTGRPRVVVVVVVVHCGRPVLIQPQLCCPKPPEFQRSLTNSIPRCSAQFPVTETGPPPPRRSYLTQKAGCPLRPQRRRKSSTEQKSEVSQTFARASKQNKKNDDPFSTARTTAPQRRKVLASIGPIALSNLDRDMCLDFRDFIPVACHRSTSNPLRDIRS